MKILSLSNRLKLVSGLLMGVAVASAAVSWALQSNTELVFEQDEQTSESTENTLMSPVAEASSSSDVAQLETQDYQIAALTHEGKKRSNNQDSFRLGTIRPGAQEQALAIVCDGMGGHAGGEVASQIAADIIWTVLSKQKQDEPNALLEAMTEAIKRADAAIDQRASKEPELQGMGTTAVMACITRHGFVHCYLGDSRLYHFRDGEFIFQTKDHSVVRFLVEEGVIQAHEAKNHPYRSQLTSSLGGGPNANRLTIAPKWSEDGEPELEWKSGDWLLLCSDGLNSELEDDEMAKVLKESSDPTEAITRLRGLVLDTEARDNVTIILAKHL